MHNRSWVTGRVKGAGGEFEKILQSTVVSLDPSHGDQKQNDLRNKVTMEEVPSEKEVCL